MRSNPADPSGEYDAKAIELARRSWMEATNRERAKVTKWLRKVGLSLAALQIENGAHFEES